MLKRLTFRSLAALLILCSILSAINVHPLPTITGVGMTVQVSTSTARVYWLQVIPDSGNMNPVMFGDSTTSISVGLPLAAGSGYTTPVVNGQTYPLNQFFVYVAMGDKVHFAYGQ